MNAKRRAELQRRLTLNAVPRPPAGLAERIKADIPKYLEPETGPQRLTRSITFNLRIAASIVVLAMSVIVAMMMVSPSPELQMASRETKARPVIFPPARTVATSDAPTDSTSARTVARTEEVHLDIVEEAPVVRQLAVARVAPPAMTPPRAFAPDDRVRARVESDLGNESAALGGAIGESSDETPVEMEAVAEMESPAKMEAADLAERAYAPAAAAPAEPVASPAPPPSIEQPTASFADAARLDRRQERAAARMTTAPPALATDAKKNSVFGISVSPQVFHDIRATLERGLRPAASAVNVEALVNYFAGPPAKRPRAVRLEVEASPAPIPADGEHAVLRFTVDTPEGSGVAASDARIDVVINDAAVAVAQRIGDSDPLARESVIPFGTSVTGLYALEMKPGLRSSQLVATVRLHYAVNGRRDSITKLVHGHDLSKSWQRSSRRHRLASLGAVWGESLKGTAAGEDVARRAEELATQNPRDVKAKELARAASASAAGGR